MLISNEFATSRRNFIQGATALAVAPLLGLSEPTIAEAPLETTRFRIANGPFICYAPQFLAEEFLRMEGFTEIEYVPVPANYTYATAVGGGKVDWLFLGHRARLRRSMRDGHLSCSRASTSVAGNCLPTSE